MTTVCSVGAAMGRDDPEIVVVAGVPVGVWATTTPLRTTMRATGRLLQQSSQPLLKRLQPASELMLMSPTQQ